MGIATSVGDEDISENPPDNDLESTGKSTEGGSAVADTAQPVSFTDSHGSPVPCVKTDGKPASALEPGGSCGSASLKSSQDPVSDGEPVIPCESEVPDGTVPLCPPTKLVDTSPNPDCDSPRTECKLSSVISGSSSPHSETSPKVLDPVIKIPDPQDTSDIPEHLKDLYLRSITYLTPEQSHEVRKLLIEFQDVFARHDLDVGEFTALYHRIATGNADPIKMRMRRTPLGFEAEEREHLQKMLKQKIIRPSESEWAAAPVLVRKKDKGLRYCIDFRKLNDVTKKDAFPLPLIDECLDSLSGNMFFSTFDLASGYWQILIHPDDCHKTAFVTRYGLFEHIRMPFGLCNAPSTFQRAMNLVLRGLTWNEVLAYLDDTIVLGKSFDHHVENIRKTLLRFRQYNLKLKPKKCLLFQIELEFLGRKVDRNGVSITPGKVETVLNWPVPSEKKHVEAFLGFVNYHREFIPDFAQIAEPLYALTGKNDFLWGVPQQEAFETLKTRMVTAPVLAYPDPDCPFILDTDASNTAIGAELSQVQDGVERTIAYGSLTLTPTQQRYCTTRKELLAVVTFVRLFRHYLLGRKFLLRTDHSSLVWLTRFRYLEGQLSRWLEELSQYNMEILHRPGKKHLNADVLSRIPDSLQSCNCYEAGKDLSSLPCGGCPYCTRAHTQWDRFESDVDDVVPLAVRQIVINPPPDNVPTRPEIWLAIPDPNELRRQQLADADL